MPSNQTGLAFDRSTVRRIDVDGRMHVEISAISKSNVCGYYGREIPKWKDLGLDPDRLYQLLRDPVELAKAATSFNNIPLLSIHIAVSSADPQKEHVVGATGSNATFTPPYLTNSLVIWDDSAIAGIESGDQRELSSSYRYDADMTPGVYEGVPYDGRMTNIIGNHVALVEAGRAGADVVVGDSQPTELPMKLTKTTVAVRAALGAHLRPLLAQDGAIPQVRALVTNKTKPADVAKATKVAFDGRIAIDEDALTKLLILAADEADEDDDDTADDEDDNEEKKADDEDEDDKEEKKSKDKAKDKAKDEDEEDKDKANDAAIKRSSDRAYRSAMNGFRAIREAEEDVRPLVGAVVAMDSAADVYRFALDSLGIDTAGVHTSAYPAMVKMAKERQAPAPRVAMDALGADSFLKDFPTASKLVRS